MNLTVHAENLDLFSLMAEYQQLSQAYRLLAERSLQGLFIFQDNHLVFANSAISQITGYSIGELLDFSSEQVFGLIHPDDRDMVIERTAARFAGTQVPERYVYRLLTQSAGQRWVEVFATPISWGGKPALQLAYIDITEKKEIEKTLHATEDRFYKTFQNNPALIVISALEDDRYLEVNDRFLTVSGYTRDEVIGRTSAELKVFKDFEDRRRIIKNIERYGMVRNFEIEFRRKSGTEVIGNLSAETIEVKGKRCLMSVIEDITERKITENSLQVQRDLALTLAATSDLKQALNHLLDAILTLPGVDCGCIVLASLENGELRLMTQRGFTDEFSEHLKFVQNNLPFARQLLEHCPYYGNIEEFASFFEPLVSNDGLMGIAILPVSSEGQIEAAVVIGSHTIAQIPATIRNIFETIVAQFEGVLSRINTEEALRSANDSLTHYVKILERRNREIENINNLATAMQGCYTFEDVCATIKNHATIMFSGQHGTLYLFNEEQTLLLPASSWGNPAAKARAVSATKCICLQQKQLKPVIRSSSCVLCTGHTTLEGISNDFVCLPIMLNNRDLLGIFHQHLSPEMEPTSLMQMATAAAERVSLSLTNIKFGEDMRQQLIRDPLTNLFNRRYLEEALELEFHQAERHKRTVGIVLIDIDFFKNFNDTYGHAAGDTLLQALGDFFFGQIRAGDIACRYGGEEFLLILPESSLDDTAERARQICQEVKKMVVNYQGTPLGKITLSLGVAAFPKNGKTPESVFMAADEALYTAKNGGRDRVVVAARK